MYCEQCGVKLEPEEAGYGGYCKECFERKNKKGEKNMEEEFYYSSSKFGTKVKDLSICFIVLGVIIGIISAFIAESIVLCIGIIVPIIIFALFVYILGEIICLLTDIRENTEHLRDKMEGK